MPIALALGVSEEKFWDSCPYDLKPYIKAQEITSRKNDENMWIQGMYFFNALSVVASHIINGKSREKYIEKPLLQKLQIEEHNMNLTEQEKEKYVDQVFANLIIMQSNFNRSKKGNDPVV